MPVATSLSWIEFALGPAVPRGFWDYGRIRIVDAGGQGAPPVSFGSALADAQFYAPTYSIEYQSWRSHYDFPSYPTLEPNHDYWLVLTTQQDYAPYARVRTGFESPQFQESIGPLYARPTSTSDAEVVPNRALAFRVIGLPIGSVGVAEASPSRRGLALEVAPNPSHGATVISWSGSSPIAGFEVMDARGRRVASGSPPAAAVGRWTFNGRSEDGRSLPVGIYFIRARDTAGRVSTARITLVRSYVHVPGGSCFSAARARRPCAELDSQPMVTRLRSHDSAGRGTFGATQRPDRPTRCASRLPDLSHLHGEPAGIRRHSGRAFHR